MSVYFSHPHTSTWCDGCGESYTQCRCAWDAELTREGPGWLNHNPADVPEGFHLWDGDRPKSLGGAARWTDLPGIIREAICDALRKVDDADRYAEVVTWLEELGYSDED